MKLFELLKKQLFQQLKNELIKIEKVYYLQDKDNATKQFNEIKDDIINCELKGETKPKAGPVIIIPQNIPEGYAVIETNSGLIVVIPKPQVQDPDPLDIAIKISLIAAPYISSGIGIAQVTTLRRRGN